MLLLALGLCGLSIRMMINAGVGVAPWDMFHIGVSLHAPLHVGQVSILVGAIIVALTWWLMREKPGLATILNVLEIGLLLDLLANVVPHPTQPVMQWAQFLVGVLLNGFGTAAYVSAGLGAGPRDGLMLSLHRQRGWPISRVRTGIELVVLLAGTLLGGPLGWGTLAYAVLIGPSVSHSLNLFRRLPS